MHLYITCDTESFDIDHKGRLVQCFLKHVGITTRIRRGDQGAKSGGMVGGVSVVFIACWGWAADHALI